MKLTYIAGRSNDATFDSVRGGANLFERNLHRIGFIAKRILNFLLITHDY